MTASHASMSVFSSRTISGDSDTVCDDNIGGELIPNRLNHALQINASRSILLIKITVGMFISAGHGTEYGSGPARHL